MLFCARVGYWLLHDSEVEPDGSVNINYTKGKYTHKGVALSHNAIRELYNSNDGRVLREMGGRWYIFRYHLPLDVEFCEDGWANVPLPLRINGRLKLEPFNP